MPPNDMEAVKVETVDLYQIRLPLVHFFQTSFGRTESRSVILLRIGADGESGWGECVAGEKPFYSYESVHTAWPILSEFLLPILLQAETVAPEEVTDLLSAIRGHPMAKAAVESALWDLHARRAGKPLWKLIGGTRNRIPCGVSIGIQDTVEQLLDKIVCELEAGYQKVKIKISPEWDVEVVERVREQFPDIPLMVDANSAYRLEQAGHLARLDAFDLMMIEQPLSYDDIYLHAQLQRQLKTPICLDESIRHARDTQMAIELKACRIVNIKMGRVGGMSEAIRVHDLCQLHETPVWCGGMLETGIGRAHNIALSTLQNFSIPGDVSASKRYYVRDTIRPPVEVDSQGFIQVPETPGIGFEPDVEWIEENTLRHRSFDRDT